MITTTQNKKVIIGLTYPEGQGREVEQLLEKESDIFDFLANKPHGEYVYIRYIDEDDYNNCIRIYRDCVELPNRIYKPITNYTFRAWYNEDDDSVDISEDNIRHYNWEKSQRINAKKIIKYLEKEGIILPH